MQAALDAVNRKMIALLGQISGGGPDLQAADVRLLMQAETQRQLLAAYDAYDMASVELANDLHEAAALAFKRFESAGINVTITDLDTGIIDAFANNVKLELDGYKLQSVGQVTDVLYMAVLTGESVDMTATAIEHLIAGTADGKGVSLAAQARLLAHDSVMVMDATVTRHKADEIGLTEYRYAGTVVSDSRPWCKEHVGKILSKEEIEKWRNVDWQGKRPGDPFITRGGYRCRHHWIPVKRSDK